jgi:hypothetical protein
MNYACQFITLCACLNLLPQSKSPLPILMCTKPCGDLNETMEHIMDCVTSKLLPYCFPPNFKGLVCIEYLMPLWWVLVVVWVQFNWIIFWVHFVQMNGLKVMWTYSPLWCSSFCCLGPKCNKCLDWSWEHAFIHS